MEMVVEKAYDVFNTSTLDSPDKILGKMSTLSFAGRMELKTCVRWAKQQFYEWMKTTDEKNP